MPEIAVRASKYLMELINCFLAIPAKAEIQKSQETGHRPSPV